MEAVMKYNGVTETTDGRYAALYFRGGKSERIGVYDSEIEAAIAHDLTVTATLGDFAVSLNFPDLSEEEAVAAIQCR
jgi:effector-binding domain-containing protein